MIDIKYQSEVIGIFKQSKSGQYNAQDRNWHFKISEHDELLAKLKPLMVKNIALVLSCFHDFYDFQQKINLGIEPLPKWILETFSKFKLKLIPDEDINWCDIEPTLAECLMPFQRDGVMYALKRNGRILLADDMGLGKTIQVLKAFA